MVLIMLMVTARVARASGSWQRAKASSDLDLTPVECILNGFPQLIS
jgi:hypothetical protein